MPKHEILLYGVIGEETAAEVKAQLADIDASDEIVVRIDSPGGSVFHGFSIFEALRNHAGPKRAVIESAAFSIASIIAMAFDDIEIAPNGYMMIHNPSLATQGDDEQLTKDAKLLSKLKSTMIEVYTKRTGIDAATLSLMLKDETYLDAKECVERGFATRVSNSSIRSRITAHNDMPYGIVASLFQPAEAGPSNPPKETPMAQETPKAASVKEIRSAFPKMSDSFILACVEKELPIAEVKEAVVDELQQQNEALQAKVDEFEAAALAKAEADEKAKAEAEKAKATATGNQPIAKGDTSGQPSARARWADAVASERAKGLSPDRAVIAANRANPGLRESMLAEVNSR